jgi:hypothetical protein
MAAGTPEAAPVQPVQGKADPTRPAPTTWSKPDEKVPGVDPIKDPDWYHKKAVTDLEVKQTGKKDKPGYARATDRPGMASVLVAPTAAIDDGPNAFGGMPLPSPMPMGPPPSPPDPFCGRQVVQAPAPSQPWSLDQGIPKGASNAFTHGGNTRPIPADFGTPQYPLNAFSAVAVDATPVLGPCAPAGTGAAMPAGSFPVPSGCGWSKPCAQLNVGPLYHASGLAEDAGAPQLLAQLKESQFPSQREWAAECLSRQDWRAQPQIIAALVTAAREDPAAAVRAGCVRALGKMKANTLPVVQTVQALKSDRDPRVRQEVDEALAALGAAPESRDGGIRPVSATVPAQGRMP